MAADDDTYLPPEATGSAPGRARLAGRRVLVVGAGTRPSPEPDPPIGNGRAITVLAAREGASVVCADRDQAAAEATATLARAEGARAEVVVADVAEPAACAAVVGQAADALGGLDGVVLNVGIGLGRGIGGTTAELTLADSPRTGKLLGPAHEVNPTPCESDTMGQTTHRPAKLREPTRGRGQVRSAGGLR